MKILIFFCIAALCLWTPFAFSKNGKPVGTKTLSPTILFFLEFGETKIIPHLNGKNIWVENGKVIKIKAEAMGIEIKGIQEGSSLLRIGNTSYKFQVLQPSNLVLWNKMKEKNRTMIGIHIDLFQGVPTLKGKIYELQDILSFQKLAGSESRFEIQAELSSELKIKMQDLISRTLEKAHLPPQNLIFGEVIEVRVRKNGEHTPRLRQILGGYGIRVSEENISLELEPLVKVEITVAEVIRDRSRKLGIQWPTELSAQIISGSLSTEKSLRILGEFFESQGAGRVLASPNILCRTGKEAEFLAGGEFPIKVGGSLRKPGDVIWKKYGVFLKVKPTADRSGRMSIGIETEVSNIDPVRTVDGIPGILTNKMSSHFDLRNPRIIALSGLLKHTEGEQIEGIWGLNKIPILGSLFSSQNFLDNRSELIIFVRPSLVDDSTDSKQQTPDKELELQHLNEIL